MVLQFYRIGELYMIKMELTAILYSKKNFDLAYRLHSICRSFSINLITALDFVELTIKNIKLKPQIIFCDTETIDFSSAIINTFLEKQEYKTKKTIFLGDDKATDYLSNFVCDNLITSKVSNLEKLLTEIQSEITYESLSTKIKDETLNDFHIDIYKLLVDLGFSMKHIGSAYLQYCLENVIANNGILHSLSSNEYPLIAANFKTTIASVERNIRNAIEKAWKNYGIKNWHLAFYSKLLKDGKKPTNREFIYMCTEILIPQLKTKMISNYT